MKIGQKPRLAFPEKLALAEELAVKFPPAIIIGPLALRWLVRLEKVASVFRFGHRDVANAPCAKLIKASCTDGKNVADNLLLQKIRGVQIPGVLAIRKVDAPVLRDGRIGRNISSKEGEKLLPGIDLERGVTGDKAGSRHA